MSDQQSDPFGSTHPVSAVTAAPVEAGRIAAAGSLAFAGTTSGDFLFVTLAPLYREASYAGNQ